VAGINERLHTPVIATVIIAIWVEFLNYMNIYQNLGALLLNVIAVMAVAFIMVGLSAIVMPFTRRSLFEAAPSMVKVRWAGIPVMTIVGVVMLVSWAFVLYVAFTTTAFGQIGVKPLIEAFAVPIIGVIYYIVVRIVRAQQGIQLKAAFQEIPPE